MCSIFRDNFLAFMRLTTITNIFLRLFGSYRRSDHLASMIFSCCLQQLFVMNLSQLFIILVHQNLYYHKNYKKNISIEISFTHNLIFLSS
jgi:hypothetical protein